MHTIDSEPEQEMKVIQLMSAQYVISNVGRVSKSFLQRKREMDI